MSEARPRTKKTGSFLRTGSVGVVSAVAMCMAFMGPVTSIAFNTQPAVGGAGLNLPLSMAMAMVVCLLVANTIAQFARKIPSAGFALSFNARAFGAAGGTFTGLLLLLGYVMVAPMLLSAIGYFTADFIDSLAGVSIPWWTLSIVYAATLWFINSRGIAESSRAALIFLVVEVGVLLGLFGTVLGRGGASGLSLSSLDPTAGGVGVSGLGVGMLWGVLYFIGFESAATLGEEARNPSRTIPRALFTGVIVIGLFYVLACYVIVNGYGSAHIGALQADATPLVTLGKRYWGVAWLVSLTILASQFANAVAGSNAAVRIMFSLGRARILPGRLGRTDERGIPQTALWIYMAFSLAAMIVAGVFIGPLGVYGLAGTILGIVMVIVYILMNVGVTRFYLREHRDEFSIWKHALIPSVASLMMLLPLYGQLVPLPAMPNLIAPCLIGAWIVAAILYVFVLSRHAPVRLTHVLPTESAEEEAAQRLRG